MSIPTYAELRDALDTVAEPIPHPTKGVYATGRNAGQPHRYGRVVYVGDPCAVVIRHDGKYLCAEAPDHGDAVLALAHAVGLTSLDPGVKIKTLTRKAFVALVAPGAEDPNPEG